MLKDHKLWCSQAHMGCESYQSLSALLAHILEWCEATNVVAEPLPVVLPPNIASEPAPPKEDLIPNHCSRFNR